MSSCSSSTLATSVCRTASRNSWLLPGTGQQKAGEISTGLGDTLVIDEQRSRKTETLQGEWVGLPFYASVGHHKEEAQWLEVAPGIEMRFELMRKP